jgi:hypothetical protein
VLLDEAGKSPNYIRKRLHWMGDSFCMYLCDTRIIQDIHRKALRLSLQEIIYLLAAQPKDVCQRTLMSDVTPNDDMGEYYTEMD